MQHERSLAAFSLTLEFSEVTQSNPRDFYSHRIRAFLRFRDCLPYFRFRHAFEFRPDGWLLKTQFFVFQSRPSQKNFPETALEIGG